MAEYDKHTWEDYEQIIDAEKLNHIEDGIGNLVEDVNQETDDREAAVKSLSDELAQEVTDRETADNNLSGSIEQETADRETADTSLSNDISQEALDRQDADTSLSNDISQEALDRQDADTSLSDSKLDKSGGDSEDVIITFDSDDSVSPTEYSDFGVLSSGETHKSLFNKLSTMAKNVRWLFSKMGTTDISKIGDGTVTGAVNELISIVNVDSAAAHNAIFRGKYLGTSVTDEQWAAIKAGTFDDLYIGDYWTINSFNWVIADFDYWYRHGDTALNTHHLVIVPGTMLYYNTYMNETNTTEGGYIGSYMYTTGIVNARNMITSAFGSSHVVTHRTYLSNAVTSGYPSGGEWVDSIAELMTEEQVYGSIIRQQSSSGGTNVNNATIDKSQLALFRYDRQAIICYGNGTNGGSVGARYAWWLRDVVSAASFANVTASGYASVGSASGTNGVRPCFAIA